MKIHPQQIVGLTFDLVFVVGTKNSPNGTFDMGDEHDDLWSACLPVHKVRVSDFYIGKFPVTQALWKDIVTAVSEDFTQLYPDISLNPAPSRFEGDDLPVERVSWDDARIFIDKLNILTQSSRPAGYCYRLPTEAEWEYAARGGIFHTAGYQYSGGYRLKDLGWYDDNSGSATKPVGQKYPNQLGIYDLSGNIWEWCEDDWHNKYDNPPDDGLAWVDVPDRGTRRVHRGGSWYYSAQFCRAANRFYDSPDPRDGNLGFRLVLALQSVG